MEIKIPDRAIELVKKWEGLHKVGKDGLVYPYLCPAGVWTIGYGSTRHFDGSPITRDTPPLSPQDCESLMLLELGKSVRSAIGTSPILIENSDALAAISSFIFNLGASRYKASTLRRVINEGNFELAKKEILRWVYASGRRLPGLYARRLDESNYLVKEEEEAPSSSSPSWLHFWEPSN